MPKNGTFTLFNCDFGLIWISGPKVFRLESKSQLWTRVLESQSRVLESQTRTRVSDSSLDALACWKSKNEFYGLNKFLEIKKILPNSFWLCQHGFKSGHFQY